MRRRIDLEHDPVSGIESDRHRGGVDGVPHEQRCHRQQERRAGDLQRHHDRTQSAGACPTDHSRRGHRRRDGEARGPAGRQEAGANAADDHEASGECRDRPVGRDVDALRHRRLGCEVGEEVVAPPRDEQRQRTAGCRNHKTLGDELLRQPGPARAQRAAQAHLAFAIDSACEQKADNVEQRDQEHDADHGHGHGGDDGYGPPFRTSCVLERDERCCAARVGRRPCPGELARHRLQLAVGLGLRRLRAKPREHVEHEHVGATDPRRESKRIPVAHPDPHVSVVEAGAEVARKHADDRHVQSVERKRETGQRRVVQLLAPEAVADDRGQLVDAAEGPADGCLHAERVEVVVGDRQSPCDCGPVTTATTERDDGLGGDIESRNIACERLEFAEGGAFAFGRATADGNQSGPRGVDGRTGNEERVHRAEGDRHRAHADGERDHRDSREARAPGQRTTRIADVPNDGFQSKHQVAGLGRLDVPGMVNVSFRGRLCDWFDSAAR